MGLAAITPRWRTHVHQFAADVTRQHGHVPPAPLRHNLTNVRAPKRDPRTATRSGRSRPTAAARDPRDQTRNAGQNPSYAIANCVIGVATFGFTSARPRVIVATSAQLLDRTFGTVDIRSKPEGSPGWPAETVALRDNARGPGPGRFRALNGPGLTERPPAWSQTGLTAPEASASHTDRACQRPRARGSRSHRPRCGRALRGCSGSAGARPLA